MGIRHAHRNVGRRSFWRGVGSGLNSPKGRADFNTYFRLAVFSSIPGSLVLLSWVKHSRGIGGQQLSAGEDLGIRAIGAFGAAGIVALCFWLWHRR
jgi:hypothetical protein